MRLDRLTPAQKHEIWAPRYKDQTVLIAKHKVGTHNEIVFTKANHLKGAWYASNKTITGSPLDTNGKIPCYAVPLSELEPLERV